MNKSRSCSTEFNKKGNKERPNQTKRNADIGGGIVYSKRDLIINNTGDFGD